MYFQMDKNEKRLLDTEEDFEKLAKSTYNLANEYFKLVSRSILLFAECHTALLANAAFASELFFKSIIYKKLHMKCYKKTSNNAETHNLYQLFLLLPEDVAILVKETHPCSNTKKEKFDIELRNVGEAFTILRYVSERKGMACNAVFIFELMGTLKDVSDDLFVKSNA